MHSGRHNTDPSQQTTYERHSSNTRCNIYQEDIGVAQNPLVCIYYNKHLINKRPENGPITQAIIIN